MTEHEHTFRLLRVELECECGVRQVHEAVHGTELWHEQPKQVDETAPAREQA